MRLYLDSARRFWPAIVAALVLVWGAGLVAAYDEYTHSFESESLVWTTRSSQLFAGGDSPYTGQTPAQEQAEVLSQLLQSKSFLRQIVEETPMAARLAAASDPDRLLRDISSRFRVSPIGSNLVRIRYRAAAPGLAQEMVESALRARSERLAVERISQASAAQSFYQRELETARTQLGEAQQRLDEFLRNRPARLTSEDEERARQFRSSLDFAQKRFDDVRTRLDRSSTQVTFSQLAEGIDFRVIDRPSPAQQPSGGLRSAALVGGIAGAVGVALGLLLLIGGALYGSARIGSEEDIARLAPAKLYGTVPATGAERASPPLRASLARASFGAVDDAAPRREPGSDP